MAQNQKLSELFLKRQDLKNALYSGALSVRHGDKQINYKNTEELNKALDALDNEILNLQGKRKNRFIYHTTSRGY